MTSLGGPKSSKRGDPHGWNALPNYLKVHHRYLDDLRDDFVLDDSLNYGFAAPDTFEIRGRVWCRHGLFVDVDKRLEIDERNRVRSIQYSYHAGFEGPEDRAIFRYDNAHRYAREGHGDEHHRHRYDHATWKEIEPPEWIGRDRWPHLNNVIEELREWWEGTGQHLGLAASMSADRAPCDGGA